MQNIKGEDESGHQCDTTPDSTVIPADSGQTAELRFYRIVVHQFQGCRKPKQETMIFEAIVETVQRLTFLRRAFVIRWQVAPLLQLNNEGMLHLCHQQDPG